MRYLYVILLFVVFSGKELNGQTVSALSPYDLIVFKDACKNVIEDPYFDASNNTNMKYVIYGMFKNGEENPLMLDILDSLELLPKKRSIQDKVFGGLMRYGCDANTLFVYLQVLGLRGTTLSNVARYIRAKYKYLCDESGKKNVGSKNDTLSYIANMRYAKGGLMLNNNALIEYLKHANYRFVEIRDSFSEYRKDGNTFGFYKGEFFNAGLNDTSIVLENGFKIGSTKKEFLADFGVRGILPNEVFVGYKNPKDVENAELENYEDMSSGIYVHFSNGKCTSMTILFASLFYPKK